MYATRNQLLVVVKWHSSLGETHFSAVPYVIRSHSVTCHVTGNHAPP